MTAMLRPAAYLSVGLLAAALIGGCGKDETQQPDNQAATARRQAIIKQHKSDR